VNNHHAAGEPTKALQRSLKDLKLSYVDAYFVHWPFPNNHAPGCDGDSRNPDSRPFSQDEFLGVWRELEALYDQGLTRHLGMNNMTVSKLEAVLPGCGVKPSLIEMELHPSFQQEELFDYCVARGIQVIGFCPLGSPNRPERDRSPEDVADTELPEVQAVAKAHGIHPALVCLKWAVQKGAIPIPFSGSEKNIRANLACVSEDPLTPAEMALLKKSERGCRLVKGQVFLWPGASNWTQLWE
jgi:diketogulonate reductase-like aldo/keto reductase